MKYPDDYVNKIICGDCLEIMKGIPDKSIDLVLTDPPYGIEGRSGYISLCRKRKNQYSSNFVDNEEYILTTVIPIFKESQRVAKRIIITPGSKYFCHYPNPDSYGNLNQRATVSMQKWGRADSQPIFYYGKDPRAGKTIQFCSVDNNTSDNIENFPCPKPLKIWKWLLERGSLKGELVLDPFLGSGTTAVACKELGRRFIGIEINPDYCQIAQKRVDNTYEQYELISTDMTTEEDEQPDLII